MDRSEDAVLKLVHPGRFVEVHRRPVAASEVMAKNPRHFVTRPDVFQFPWIVVRPESLLKPGNVFYIVPCHTLYRLQRRHDTLPRRSPRRSTRRYQKLRPPAIDPWPADPAVVYSNVEVLDDDGGTRPAAGKLKSCLKKGRSSSAAGHRGHRRVAFKLPGVENEEGDVENEEGEESVLQGFECSASKFFESSSRSCM